MRMKSIIAAAAMILAAGCATQPTGPATAYEGARVIVGDGRVIDNATLVVRGEKLVEVGRDVRVPDGTARVSLAGKTVMPMIIDTHVHLSADREALIRDLRQRAYYGVSAVASLGTDGYGNLDVRHQNIPGAARFLSAGRGITMAEPGRTSSTSRTRKD